MNKARALNLYLSFDRFLLQSMINLAYSTESTELRKGLNLPCDIADFEVLELEEHLDRVSNRAYLRELRKGVRLSERFARFARGAIQ